MDRSTRSSNRQMIQSGPRNNPTIQTQRDCPVSTSTIKREQKRKFRSDDEILETRPSGVSPVNSTSVYQSDARLVSVLVDAMNDMTVAQDNPGMLETWRRLVLAKAPKVRRVCEDLLVRERRGRMTTKRCHAQNGVPLGERKPLNAYPNFDDRFNALCTTLQTQKTVCKHLMEDPYSYQVVDDPLTAQRRVQNNRRVNLQKKEVIDNGRRVMGEKAQGKGRPNVKLDAPTTFASQDQNDESEDCADNGLGKDSEIEMPRANSKALITPPSKRMRCRRHGTELKNERNEMPSPRYSTPRAATNSRESLITKMKQQQTPQSISTVQRTPSYTGSASYSPSIARFPEISFGDAVAFNSGVYATPTYSDFEQPLRNYFDPYAYSSSVHACTNTGNTDVYRQHSVPLIPLADSSSRNPFMTGRYLSDDQGHHQYGSGFPSTSYGMTGSQYTYPQSGLL